MEGKGGDRGYQGDEHNQYTTMSKGITNRIKEIDSKLDEMRLRYKTASQGMKIFLEQGAKLLKSERNISVASLSKMSSLV